MRPKHVSICGVGWLVFAVAFLIAGCQADFESDSYVFACQPSQPQQCDDGFQCRFDPSRDEHVCVAAGVELEGDADFEDAGSGDAGSEDAQGTCDSSNCGTKFAQVVAGDAFSCALDEDGRVECWGAGEQGQTAPPPTTFTQISAGDDHACGLTTEGGVECWGADDDGSAVPKAGPFSEVAAGGRHTCALRSDDGYIECWGNNEFDQAAPTPADVVYEQVSAGAAHSCGLVKQQGTRECWGTGNGSVLSFSPQAGGFNDIAVGRFSPSYFACALRGGEAVCWGDNERAMNARDGTYTQIAVGGNHACGLTTAGRVQCWGKDTFGQTDTQSDVFTQVATGLDHTCGLLRDQSIKCWGLNGNGEATPP